MFNFIMKQEGLDFVESVKLVASKAHIDVSHLLAQRSSVSDTEKARLVKYTILSQRFITNSCSIARRE